jgi:argininosuccinate lyase
MTTPWLTLEEGELTGVSSIMPQKRNPVALNDIRIRASDVLGSAATYLFKAHNVPHGVPDYKGNDPVQTLVRTSDMLGKLTAVVKQLTFNAPRALEEVNADYATTTELADILQRDADVPFRVGHHFASDLVTYGRSNSLRPTQIPFAAAQEIYAKAAAHFGLKETKLPARSPRKCSAWWARNGRSLPPTAPGSRSGGRSLRQRRPRSIAHLHSCARGADGGSQLKEI